MTKSSNSASKADSQNNVEQQLLSQVRPEIRSSRRVIPEFVKSRLAPAEILMDSVSRSEDAIWDSEISAGTINM